MNFFTRRWLQNSFFIFLVYLMYRSLHVVGGMWTCVKVKWLLFLYIQPMNHYVHLIQKESLLQVAEVVRRLLDIGLFTTYFWCNS